MGCTDGGRTLFHQSERATDCRWLRVLVKCAAGKLFLPGGEGDEIIGYPNVGDLRKVRPSIRALEGPFTATSTGATRWSTAFWQESMTASPCIPLTSREVLSGIESGTTLETVRLVRGRLVCHTYCTRNTKDIDPRHDTRSLLLRNLRRASESWRRSFDYCPISITRANGMLHHLGVTYPKRTLPTLENSSRLRRRPSEASASEIICRGQAPNWYQSGSAGASGK